MTSTTESITFCLPVLNEVEVIESVLNEWISVAKSLNADSQILIDDGGSSDGTIEVINRISSTSPIPIKLILNSKPDGFGNAAKRLLKTASTDWVFFTDSDGQYVASDFLILWERRSHFDFVRGIKLGRQDPLLRRVTSLIWNKSVNFLFELPVSDVNAAFLLIKKSLLNRILPNTRILPTMVLSEIIIRAVLDNAEFGHDLYVRHRARKSGVSRATPGLKLLKVGIKQIKGLFQIKADYRIKNFNAIKN